MSATLISQDLARPARVTGVWKRRRCGAGETALDAESLAVSARCDARVPLEKAAEESDVLVADGVADFLHAAVVAFQQPLGRGDAQFLDVAQRAVAGSVLEAAYEVAQTHADASGGELERE